MSSGEHAPAAEQPSPVGQVDPALLYVIGRLDEINDRLNRGSERMSSIETELRSNTDTTRDVRELMELGRNGFKVLGHIGTAVKWLGGIAAALVACWSLYQAWKNGTPPSSK